MTDVANMNRGSEVARGASLSGAVTRGARLLALASLITAGCDSSRSKSDRGENIAAPGPSLTQAAVPSGAAENDGVPSGTAPKPKKEPATAEAARSREENAPSCPPGMQFIPAGEFRVGSPGTKGPDDEHPSFTTRMHNFCLDRTEVTAAAYAACVAAGKCSSAKRTLRTCTEGRAGREQHPINCVSWLQASAYCARDGRRLPSEFEWEYAARGGAELRKFSFGDMSPDGHTCWKQPHTCEVGQYTEGAFGLHDMSGNVWEWTDSLYGPYPWPASSALSRVYRGGSWSRRFEKWLSPTLRNRYGEDKWGSHLGFRCASLPSRATCPYGETQGSSGVDCKHGIESVEGHASSAQPAGTVRRAGSSPSVSASAAGAPPESPAPAVTLVRSPAFDGDCRTHQPGRPNAYRLQGGTHAARNLVGQSKSCKNRDVGVGWNSVCCP